MNRKSLKRIPLVLLAVVLALSMLPVFSCADAGSCSESEDGQHHWIEEGVSIEPTCTEPGERTAWCLYCSEPTMLPIEALGHDWDDGTVTSPATCTADGVKTFTCKRCGEKRTESIPATGHAWDGGTVTTAATCTAAGVKTYTCANCGATQTEAIPAAGHTAEAIPAVAATCEAAGSTEGSRCSVCGTILTAPQTIPATGHNWGEWVVDVPSTCTQAGLEYLTCRNCSAQQWRYGELAEHDWDEGTVTKEPGYLEEGEITYTCRVCGETKTEAAPLKEVPGEYSGVMSMLRKDPTEGEKLVIITQPAGGTLTDGFTLSVEAEGGTEPYTYEWYRLNGRESIIGAAAFRSSGRLGSRLKDRYDKAFSAAGRLAKLHSGSGELPGGAAEATISAKAFSDHVGDNSPQYTPEQPGTYYCVITDDAGNTVTSERAKVTVPFYIAEQPKNANKHGNDAAYLRCAAAGGEPAEDGTYTYTWYQYDGDTPVFLTENNTGRVQVFETGEYFCEAKDSAGSVETSVPVQVYDTELLTAKVVNDFMPILPDDTPRGTFVLNVSGGVPPYECSCTYDGETETQTLDAPGSCDWDSSRPGTYSFTVTDSMGETATAAAKTDYMPLYFEQQPEGGKLPSDGNGIELKVTVSDHEEYPPAAPFTWTLYRDGEAYLDGISETREITANPGEPGEYMFHVEDSGGRKGDTVIATVEDSEIQIVRIDVDGVWKREGDTVQLMVITEGNIALAYRWYWLGTEKAIDAPVVGEEVLCEVDRPGEYMVRVEDVNHKFAWGYCTVEYTGTEPLKPFILEQPKDWVWMEADTNKEVRKVTLHCKATGEHLLYNWMKEGGDWLPIGGGETLEMTGTQQELAGRYYCIVYDFDTGKETRSDTVYVQVKLSCEITGLEGDYLYWSVQGGFGPWKVEIYDGKYLVDWDTYAWNPRNSISHRTKVKSYENIPIYDKETGKWVPTKVENHFHLVVTDWCGQTCESDVY